MESQTIDIKDFEVESKAIDEQTNVIRDSFIRLGFDYANKISGKLQNDKFYQSRDNIIYRINSCRFLNNKAWEIRMEYEQEQFNPLFMSKAQYPILWMTDSLIFNLSSLFDYTAGMLEFIVGKEGMNEMKWNSVCNSFNNKEPHKSTVFANFIKEIHGEFVDKLFRFRSTVIHHKVQAGGSTYSHEVMNDKKTLQQFCSNGFLKNFKPLKKEFPEKNITIQFANFWLMNKSLKYLNHLLQLSAEHLEQTRKIPKGKEIITRKSE